MTNLEEIRQKIQALMADAAGDYRTATLLLEKARVNYNTAVELADEHGLLLTHHARGFDDLITYMSDDDDDDDGGGLSRDRWNSSNC